MKFILILILHTPVHGYYNNSAVTLQEFDSQTQCEYAAKLIRENVNDGLRRAKMIACIYK